MPANASNITILGPKSGSSSDLEPKTDLLLETFQGREALGAPYRYDLTILSENAAIPVGDLLGKPLTVRIDSGADVDPQHQYRYFNGIVAYFAKVGPTLRHTRYAVVLVPTLARLAYAQNCRIFNDASNAGLDPESGPPSQDTLTIVKKVLKQREVTLIKDITADSNVDVDRRYCVQYRETDLNFVQRLLEDEGIYYFFTHEADKHTLVLANLMANHDTVPGYDSVLCRVNRDDRNTVSEHFWGLRASGALYPSKFSVLRGYDYTTNRAKQAQIEWQVSGEEQPGSKFEAYDYPGGLTEEEQASQDAMVRMQTEQAANTVIEVEGNTLGLGVGDLVKLTRATDEHYNPFWSDADLDKKYLITQATYSISINEHESGDTVGAGDAFTARYNLLDSELQFRPRRTAFKPRIEGPQTAVVVGEGDEDDDDGEGDQQEGGSGSAKPPSKDKDEIYTDKLGRVKVKLDWDRSHRRHQKASCWVRVAQVWAGQQWGAIHIPRVGQEVIVEFLDGDPDRPIITGRVYNTDNMPPYTLPKNKTQSGIKSRSSMGGTDQNFNEIRFEDLKGKEELHIQAEKDMSTTVKHNQSTSVGADRSVSVGGNHSVSVTGTQSTTVTKKETQTYKAEREMKVTGTNLDEITGAHTGKYHAGRTETVEKGDTLEVVGSDKTVTVHGEYNTTADTQFKVTQGGNTLFMKGKDIVVNNGGCEVNLSGSSATVTANSEVAIKCGSASISMKSDGTIEITGVKVKIGNANNNAAFEPSGTTVNGVKVTSASVGMHEISGALIKIG